MNFPFYIARRYLISKKSHNIINIISVISLIGVMVGSMALVVVLSVFNGLESMVEKNFNSINPDFVITPKHGKVFNVDSSMVAKLSSIDGVAGVTKVLDDIAMLKYNDQQIIARLKGVDDNYGKFNHFDTLITEGKFTLKSGDINRAIFGVGVAYNLGVNLGAMKSVTAYYPNRFSTNMSDFSAINSEVMLPSGFFSVQTESDLTYVFVPLQLMQSLTQYENQVTAYEVSLAPKGSSAKVKSYIQNVIGPDLVVKNRYQQEEVMYRIMQMEKIAVFIILSFILFLATFNIVGTITMLIIEKKKDVQILRNMGASKSLIEKIFIAEGVLINLLGGGLGLLLGAAICFVQQQFGLITMGQTNAEYLITAYPVQMNLLDFVLIFVVISITGILSTWIPVKRIIKTTFAQ